MWNLIGAADAQAGAGMWRLRRYIRAVKQDAPGTGRDIAGNHIEQRGFAAVRPDYGQRFAGRDGERTVSTALSAP